MHMPPVSLIHTTDSYKVNQFTNSQRLTIVRVLSKHNEMSAS